MRSLKVENKRILLDGGLGRELRFRGVELPKTIWSAGALITNPEVVLEVHRDYIAAGADIITTNTYGIIRQELAKDDIEDRFTELNTLACRIAIEARERSGREVVIAGGLPPLGGSYRPDLVRPRREIEPLYQEQAQLLAPHVDLLLCETMSSAAEGRIAAEAACRTGKPVWLAWTLHEDRSGRLRSNETIAEAVAALQDLPVSGFLVNCCAPESITAAMPQLVETGAQWIGGYANTFSPVPKDWRLDGERDMDGLLPLRTDLNPEAYGAHVTEWLAAGATAIGGCCGTRPAHTARMRMLIDEMPA